MTIIVRNFRAAYGSPGMKPFHGINTTLDRESLSKRKRVFYSDTMFFRIYFLTVCSSEIDKMYVMKNNRLHLRYKFSNINQRNF